MKKIFTTILLLLISSGNLFAQESLTSESTDLESNNSYFDLELKRGTQNPLNREIPYTVYITPKIDSERTQILWDVPSVFTLKTKHSEFLSFKKDSTYTLTATLKPEREGSYNIAVNVISWQHDTNKTNTVTDILTISRGLTVSPPDPSYSLMVIILFVSILLISGLGIFFLVKVLKKSIVRIKKWLTPPY